MKREDPQKPLSGVRLSVRFVAEAPNDSNVTERELVLERRQGYDKWAYLRCPRCAELIALPLGNPETTWAVDVDTQGRPSIRPSIWQTGSCGAHFVVRRGFVFWCTDRRLRKPPSVR